MIFCSACHALNRVDYATAQNQSAECGKCHAPVQLPAAPANINFNQLEKIVRNTDDLVVVDVYADWCGPCKSYSPIFSEISNRLANKANFFKINSERSPEVSIKYNIRGIPTTLFFKQGKLLKTQSGLLNADQLASLIS